MCHVRCIVPAYIVRAYYNTWLVSNEKKEDDDMILNWAILYRAYQREFRRTVIRYMNVQGYEIELKGLEIYSFVRRKLQLKGKHFFNA